MGLAGAGIGGGGRGRGRSVELGKERGTGPRASPSGLVGSGDEDLEGGGVGAVPPAGNEGRGELAVGGGDRLPEVDRLADVDGLEVDVDCCADGRGRVSRNDGRRRKAGQADCRRW